MSHQFLQACEQGDFGYVREALLSSLSSSPSRDASWDVSEFLNAAYFYRDDRYSPLVLAASNGHVEIVRLLLQHGASATYRSPSGRSRKGTTPLHEAAEAGHAEVLRSLLASERQQQGNKDDENDIVNLAISYMGVTPLYVAAAHGHVSAVEVLLEAGANNYCKHDPHLVDTPLLMACTYSHEDVVRVLLRNSTANINDSDSAGRTPLFLAVKVRNLNIVRQLLRAGADVNRTENHFFNTALHEAVKRDRLDIVQELLASNNGSGGVAQLLENHLGETPLLLAIERGSLAIVRTIVQARRHQVFALNDCDGSGRNQRAIVNTPHPLYNDNRQPTQQRMPLHYSCSFMNSINLDMVKLLHDMGANVNQQDSAYLGATPLMLCSRCDRSACSSGRCKVRTAEYLIQCGADLLIADNHGRTPLHYASQSGCEAMVKLLLRTRAKHKVDEPDCYNATPLHFAVLGYSSRGSAKVVQLLIDKGNADVNYQDSSGMTPLHIASRSGAVDIVEALLQRNANLSLASIDSRKTPLHLAVEAGHLDVVCLLVRHCSRIDEADVHGWTPLAIACAHGNADIVYALMAIHLAGERANMEHVRRLLLHTAKSE